VTTVALLAPLAAFGVVLNAAVRGLLPMFCRSNGHYEALPSGVVSSALRRNLPAALDQMPALLHIDFSFVLDQLSLVMLLVVTGVGFLIHVYSVGYMGDDEGYARYFSYLNLFLFFMTVLVLAGNALVMFIGWEGVGLASYLLIGFYFQKKSAADAGKKAFIVNRIGDFGFLIAMFLLVANFGTLTFTEIAAKLRTGPRLAGRRGHGDRALPDAGRGGQERAVAALHLAAGRDGRPHAGLRADPRGHHGHGRRLHGRPQRTFSSTTRPSRSALVATVGAATAIFAATIALVQNDIKRVLAYSTISQLGYMFLGCGVAAYSAAIFHLMTHAFFKALLFLAAGSVIHGLGGEQDLRKMGGLWKKLPVTFAVTTVGVLAIAGIFPFAGFFSKDAILMRRFCREPTARFSILSGF
jgi:NADH-quinone oxidoreductase subunit L